jgi:phosphoserine phosphatase
MSNLVVQGLEIATGDLKALAKLSRATSIERISATAFRLRDAQPADEVASLCEQARLDYAYVPPGRQLSDFGLVVMDMDSTLITIECIDEIADMQGIKPQVASITASAMRGEIDYSESLRRRVQLLAGLDESALDRVYRDRLTLTAGAEVMLKSMRAAGMRTLLVSGGFSFFTARLRERLGLDAAYSNEPEIVDGRFTGRVLGGVVDGAAKAHELCRMRAALGLAREQVIGIGDGANDVPFLREAGVSIAFRAKPAVRAATTHCIDHVGLDGVLALFE